MDIVEVFLGCAIEGSPEAWGDHGFDPCVGVGLADDEAVVDIVELGGDIAGDDSCGDAYGSDHEGER